MNKDNSIILPAVKHDDVIIPTKPGGGIIGGYVNNGAVKA